MNVWALIIIASIMAAMQPILLKQYVNEKNNNNDLRWIIILFVLICEMILIKLYLEILSTNDLIVANSIIKIFSLLVVAIVSFYFFKEKITTKELMGIIVALFAIYLLA